MKKVLITFFIIILTLTSNVQAVVKEETSPIYNIIINAEVPETFDKNILINFELENGTNALYCLEKQNQYICKSKILAGRHKIKFIDIVSKDKEYNIKFQKDITVNSDVAYSLDISEKEDNDIKNNKNNSIKNDIKKDQESDMQKEVKDNFCNSFWSRHKVTFLIVLTLSGCYIIKNRRIKIWKK